MSDLADVKLLTIAEIAKAARVSKMTIYRMVHSGELAAVRVGRGYRVPEQHALTLLGVSATGGLSTADTALTNEQPRS